MSRKPNLIPSRILNLALPLPVFEEMEKLLFSELENRVPFGEYSRWISQRIREHITDVPVDLALFIPDCTPGVFILRGDKDTVKVLLTFLQRVS